LTQRFSPVLRFFNASTADTKDKRQNTETDKMALITGLAHINVTVPPSTLNAAGKFYGTTLGLTPRPVPAAQKDSLAWFDIGDSGQQVHVAFHRGEEVGDMATKSSRHPCFKVASPEKLFELQTRIYKHFVDKTDGAPVMCDVPGDEHSGQFSFLRCP
jgi:hypothetical protein